MTARLAEEICQLNGRPVGGGQPFSSVATVYVQITKNVVQRTTFWAILHNGRRRHGLQAAVSWADMQKRPPAKGPAGAGTASGDSAV